MMNRSIRLLRLNRISKISKVVSLILLPLSVVLLSAPLIAQRGAGVQEDPAGEWSATFQEDRQERGSGPEIGDYLGVRSTTLPALRPRVDANIVGLPENMCKGHSADHSWREPATVRIWKEVDQQTQRVTAYHTFIQLMGPEETFYVDGRTHPPDYAPYSWQGFSTGKWEGDVLAVTTDHLKNNLLAGMAFPVVKRPFSAGIFCGTAIT